MAGDTSNDLVVHTEFTAPSTGKDHCSKPSGRIILQIIKTCCAHVVEANIKIP